MGTNLDATPIAIDAGLHDDCFASFADLDVFEMHFARHPARPRLGVHGLDKKKLAGSQKAYQQHLAELMSLAHFPILNVEDQRLLAIEEVDREVGTFPL